MQERVIRTQTAIMVAKNQEVEEAERVLAQLLQDMNAEKAKFKEEELHSDVTSDRYTPALFNIPRGGRRAEPAARESP